MSDYSGEDDFENYDEDAEEFEEVGLCQKQMHIMLPEHAFLEGLLTN